MITRIVLRHYMAHKQTSLELGKGLTVLSGPNNCGKSALVSALQTVAYNESGDYMVRHGASECSVTVETDDSHTVTWRRDKGTVTYEIDGESYTRLGRKVPDALQHALRLPKVEASGGGEFDVHFASQKSPLFLLDQPSSRAAGFFASHSDAAHLVGMQTLHRERVRSDSQQLKRIEQECTRLDAALELPVPLDELEEAVSNLEAVYTRLKASQDRIEAGKNTCRRLAASRQEIHQFDLKLSLLDDVKPPPELKPTDTRTALLDRMRRERQQIGALQKQEAEVAAAIEALKGELSVELKAHPQCPVCGQAVTVEHLLTSGGDHA